MGRYLVDYSAIRDGAVPDLIESGKLVGELVIRRSSLLKAEEDARRGEFRGVEGIKAIREAAEKMGLQVTFTGDDGSKVYEEALRLKAKLVSSDPVVVRVAEALGIETVYCRPTPRFKLESLFQDGVMSVHLKEGLPPYVKRGKPGAWRFERVGDKPLERWELEAMFKEIVEEAQACGEGFVEIRRSHSTIIQLGSYRIVVTEPPLSDGMEITAVRPIAKLCLEEYDLPRPLMERFEKKAEGILIAGPPGMGKTTFAQALAEFYLSKGRVVKTIESPRDMTLPPEATQYSRTAGSLREIYDVLLLSRPDYTVFDEMRSGMDFKLYADLRLAGVGMIGVVHATSPIDAIQRFVDRIELGMIPSIVDTVVFIEAGRVSKVYTLEASVKIPHGLEGRELARPTIVVKNFMTGMAEYELYVFGKKTFIVPIKPRKSKAERVVDNYLANVPEYDVSVEGRQVVVRVPAVYMNMLKARKVRRLEKALRGLNLVLRLEAC